ncbi:branched chain amino acid aminotransferase, partial [bacterium AH-315-B15]|nr:branched chain amino acid aminotransferase [bacterium AH-315-B15]
IAKDWGMKIEERKVRVDEIITALKDGTLQDAFGAGTAATIAPISKIAFEGVEYELPAVEGREFSNKVKEYITDLKRGRAEDKFGWLMRI